jgi:hypothetical protein
MEAELACPRCLQRLSPEDTVECDGDRVVHLDCRLPRRLSREERALLFHYCSDHPVAECGPCARRFRQNKLLWGPLAGGTDRCPQCREDLTDSVRAHLYSCAMLPAEVRRRAQEIRAASQQLVKHAGQLPNRADVLMREAEVAMALLRDAMKQSAVEGLAASSVSSSVTEACRTPGRRRPFRGVPATAPSAERATTSSGIAN